MPGILHHPFSLECTASTSCNGTALPNLFDIGIRYHESGNVQRYPRVYIPVELLPYVLNEHVKAVHLEPIEGGFASKALEGAPDYLVMGIDTKQGQRVSILPEPLRRARKRRMVWGFFACALSLSLLPLSLSAILGGLGLILGTNLLRTAREIPHRPFFVFAERGWDFPAGK